jgi:predicted transcriptional regulator of viral defense system
MPANGRISIHMESKFGQVADSTDCGDPTERERHLLALAEVQHGVLTLDQLRAWGLSAPGVRRRVARGRLHRIHQGVYALARPDVSVEGRWMAAVLACGEGALLSHVSAADLHRLLSSAGPTIDVTVPRRVGLSRRGIRVHRSTCLIPVDRASVGVIPCTSIARTLLDLAGVVHRRALERACDQAEVLGVLDMDAVREVLARTAGHPGVRRLRAVVETGQVGENVSRTHLEQRFLELCRGTGLSRPAVNEWIAVTGEEIQVDFVWFKQRVIVETDGFGTHGTRQAFQRDRRRDQLLSLAGWRVVRFTWDEVTKEPGYVTDVVRKLLASHAKSRPAAA